MELTKEQIQRVGHYLDKKNITYIDVRLEVLDNIVSDIETKMIKENLDFETIFYNVTDKWNTQLEQSSSYYFGSMFTVPKIVLEKAKKHYKKYYFIGIIAFIIPFLFLRIINQEFTESVNNNINLIFQTITGLTLVAYISLFIIKSINDKQTTYRFILRTQSFNIIFIIILLIDFDFFTKNGNFDAVKVGFLVTFIFFTFTYFHFLKKHQEAIKKYKIS